MSIAIHSSSASGRSDRAGDGSAIRRHRESAEEAREADRAADSKAPKPRQALMEALSDALATLSSAAKAPEGEVPETAAAPVDSKAQKAALHEFAHELFNALRPSGPEDGGPGRHGRGFAWGRTSVGDIAQRLEALAQSLSAHPAGATPGPATPPSTDPAVTPPVDPAPVSGAGASDTTTATDTAAAAATPADPNAAADSTTDPAPATQAVADTAPVVVPSATGVTVDSPLLAAFRRLASAQQGSAADGTDVSAADQLAALLHRMAEALTHSGADVPAVGGLVDVSV